MLRARKEGTEPLSGKLWGSGDIHWEGYTRELNFLVFFFVCLSNSTTAFCYLKDYLLSKNYTHLKENPGSEQTKSLTF